MLPGLRTPFSRVFIAGRVRGGQATLTRRMGEKGRGEIKRKRKGRGQVAGTVRSFRFHVSFLHVNSFSLYQLPIPRPSPPLCSHRLIKQQKSRTVLESQVIVGMGRNPEKNAPRGKRYLKEVPQMPAIVRLIIISHCFHLCASWQYP